MQTYEEHFILNFCIEYKTFFEVRYYPGNWIQLDMRSYHAKFSPLVQKNFVWILRLRYRFSGITENDLKRVTTKLRDVQAVLLNMFSAQTILIGHSLESDFLALKVRKDDLQERQLTGVQTVITWVICALVWSAIGWGVLGGQNVKQKII